MLLSWVKGGKPLHPQTDRVHPSRSFTLAGICRCHLPRERFSPLTLMRPCVRMVRCASFQTGAGIRAVLPNRITWVAAGVAAGSVIARLATAAKSPQTPDLSGIWGRNTLNLEQPLSGPGPVVSKLRRANGTIDAFGAVVGNEANPILKPQAAEAVRRRGEIELTGRSAPNPHNQCWPEPTPFVLSLQFGMQIVQQRNEVILLYVGNNQVRRVRMNVPHPANLMPHWQGDSVGHYEGDTLIVDTVGTKVGPLSIVDMYGAPFSTALHVIERYRLIDGSVAQELQSKQASLYAPGPLRRSTPMDGAISTQTPQERDCRSKLPLKIPSCSRRLGRLSSRTCMLSATGRKRFALRTPTVIRPIKMLSPPRPIQRTSKSCRSGPMSVDGKSETQRNAEPFQFTREGRSTAMAVTGRAERSRCDRRVPNRARVRWRPEWRR